MKHLETVKMAVLFCLFSLLSYADLSFDAFEVLEGKHSSFWKKISKEDEQELSFYKTLYEKNLPLLFKEKPSSLKIPKVMHWIWVGPKSFPETSVAFVQSWKKHHPEWVLKFWTDRPDRPCPVEGMEKHLIDEISFTHLKEFVGKTDNFGERSDLLRYEILFHEGGLYVDHDVECFQPFDPFHHLYDFYACLEPPHRNGDINGRIFPCNGLIGMRAQHPIILATMQHVQKRWKAIDQKYPGSDAKSCFARVIERTFHSFTLGTRERVDQLGNTDIVFPAAFFYPDRIFSSLDKESLRKQGIIYASHHFAGSWIEGVPEDIHLKKIQRLKQEIENNKRKITGLYALLVANALLAGTMLALFLRKKSHENN